MKNLLFVFALILVANFSNAQEWQSTYSTNTLHAENGQDQLNPIKVGLGTASPTAQLHATSTIRFSGLATASNIPNFIIGSDTNGNLFRYNSSGLGGSDDAWKLTGNVATASNFLGTTNNQHLRFRTNNAQRMILTNIGRLGLGATNPLMHVDARYNNNTAYTAQISGAGNWNNSNGLFLYNVRNATNRFSSITLGSAVGGNLSISKINSVGTAIGQSALTFQTENSGNSDMIRERMRITHDGTVEINLQDYSDNVVALHTEGQLQFDGLPSGSGNVLVLDANNRVRVATSSSNATGTSTETSQYIKKLEDRLEALESKMKLFVSLNEMETTETRTTQISKVELAQNVPNPTSDYTSVDYLIESDFDQAVMHLFTLNGELIKSISIADGKGSVEFDTSELENGAYVYSLEVDGKIIETKKLVKQAGF